MTTTPTDSDTESDIDLFAADFVDDPFPTLAELRQSSPAVHMTRHDFWLLTRYRDVKRAALDWETFSSAQGVALTPQFNERLVGSVLATDPPEHDVLRSVLSERLAPRGLSVVREQVRSYAFELVERLVGTGTFDAVDDLAAVYPINIVADLVGLSTAGREVLHPGADATFAAFGPWESYVQEHMQTFVSYQTWMASAAERETFEPGSWGDLVLSAVRDGKLSETAARTTLGAYMTAGMDTTVNSIAAMIRLFAERPEVWTTLQDEPALGASLFEEILRLESPVQGFWRVATKDADVDGTAIPSGSRVMLHWGAANRDPNQYMHPDDFDIRRNPIDHLAFGYGLHGCAGQGLARLEIAVLLEALQARVQRFELTGDVRRRGNPIVRSLASVPIEVVPVAS